MPPRDPGSVHYRQQENGIGADGEVVGDSVALPRRLTITPTGMEYATASCQRERGPAVNDSLLTRSAELNAARRRLHETFNRRDRSPAAYAAWSSAAKDVKAAFRRMYAPEFQDAFERLRQGDRDAVEPAVSFLEADPHTFRSGYIKADLVRFLKRINLDPETRRRLRGVLLKVVEAQPRREFRDYCRLATALDSPELRSALRERTGEQPPIGRQARWMLEALGEPRTSEAGGG